jgi:hypothetical protein
VGFRRAESRIRHLQSLVVWLNIGSACWKQKSFFGGRKMGIRLEQWSLRNIRIPHIGRDGRHVRGKMASTSLSANSSNLLKYHVHHRLQRDTDISIPSMLPVSVWRGKPGSIQQDDSGLAFITTPSG